MSTQQPHRNMLIVIQSATTLAPNAERGVASHNQPNPPPTKLAIFVTRLNNKKQRDGLGASPEHRVQQIASIAKVGLQSVAGERGSGRAVPRLENELFPQAAAPAVL